MRIRTRTRFTAALSVLLPMVSLAAGAVADAAQPSSEPPAAAPAKPVEVDVLALRYAVLLGGKAGPSASTSASGALSQAELTGFLSRWDPQADSDEVRRVFSLNSLGEVVRQAALLPLEGGSLAGNFERGGTHIDLELGVQALRSGAGALVSVEIARRGEVLAAPRVSLAFGSRAVLSTEILGDPPSFVFVVVEVERTTRQAVTARGVLGTWKPDARVIDGVSLKAPKALESPQPEYPEEAKGSGVEGVATVAVTIGADGRVEKAELVEDPGHGLGKAAVDAARRWRFEPPTENGRRVRATMVLTMRFDLP